LLAGAGKRLARKQRFAPGLPARLKMRRGKAVLLAGAAVPIAALVLLV
jgi:hypothetical protein